VRRYGILLISRCCLTAYWEEHDQSSDIALGGQAAVQSRFYSVGLVYAPTISCLCMYYDRPTKDTLGGHL
jgi:hypothetical protein